MSRGEVTVYCVEAVLRCELRSVIGLFRGANQGGDRIRSCRDQSWVVFLGGEVVASREIVLMWQLKSRVGETPTSLHEAALFCCAIKLQVDVPRGIWLRVVKTLARHPPACPAFWKRLT